MVKAHWVWQNSNSLVWHSGALITWPQHLSRASGTTFSTTLNSSKTKLLHYPSSGNILSPLTTWKTPIHPGTLSLNTSSLTSSGVLMTLASGGHSARICLCFMLTPCITFAKVDGCLFYSNASFSISFCTSIPFFHILRRKQQFNKYLQPEWREKKSGSICNELLINALLSLLLSIYYLI